MPFQTVDWEISFFPLGILLLLLGGALLFKKTSARPWSISWLGILAVLFLFISFYVHPQSFSGNYLLLRLLLLGGLFYFIREDAVLLDRAGKVCIFAAVVESVLACVQVLPHIFSQQHFGNGAFVLTSSYGEILRASGSFAHPNILGFFLVFAFFLLEPLTARWKNLRYVLIVGILLTFSRSAFLALLLGIFLQGIFSQENSRPFREKYGSPFVILSLLGLVFRQYFDTISPSNGERISQLGVAWESIKSAPFFGIGAGNFPVAMAKLAPFAPWELQPVHNLFLLFGSEFGLIVGLSFGYLFVKLWKNMQKIQDLTHRKMLLGLWATLCIFAFFEHLLFTSLVGVFCCCFAMTFFFTDADEDLSLFNANPLVK